MKEQPILGTVSKDEIQKEEVKHKRLSEVRGKNYETNATIEVRCLCVYHSHSNIHPLQN